MNVIRQDNTFGFDVDETLIMHCDPNLIPTKRPKDAIEFNFYGQKKWAVPHYGHIELLIASVARGRHTVVWTGNGFAWAEEVLTKLGLDHLSVTVMSKPIGVVDDMPVETWIGSRFYIPHKEKLE